MVVLMEFRGKSRQTQHYAQEAKGRVADSVQTNINEVDFHTSDLLNIPTILTALGVVSVYRGAKNIDTVKGVNKIRNGRALDVADGFAARTLNQESDAGALADVVADKVSQLMIAIAAWKRDALPKKLISYLFVKNIAHTFLTLAASFNHPGESFRTPQANKIAMALENIGAGLLLEANAYEQEQPQLDKHAKREALGYIAVGASLVFEAAAIAEMLKRLDKDTPVS